jgi:dGTPase
MVEKQHRMNWKVLLKDRRPHESTKKTEIRRNRFQQDYDRIVFSHPFRMLQDKTQVFPLPKQDFVHTRLTHSLEVAVVGRSLGQLVGGQIIGKHKELSTSGLTAHDFGSIVSAASLMHDLGNPPFGHAGENAISQFFRREEITKALRNTMNKKEQYDLINFEGNAQSFRLVNMNNYQGLKLTYATLGAFSKYPRESLIHNQNPKRKSQKKYGFLQGNKEAFQQVATEIGLIPLSDSDDLTWCRHPLAFLVEAADDICYNIIDLEDGTNLGLVSLNETEALLTRIIESTFDPKKYNQFTSDREKVSVLRAMAIQKLIIECVNKFVELEEDMLTGSFDQALCENIPSAHVLHEIQTLSVSKIYQSKRVLEREIAGFEVLNGLLGAFFPAILEHFSQNKPLWHNLSLIRLLPDDTQTKLKQASSQYEAVLLLLDYISGLTDSHALSLFRNIRGISFAGGQP